jgi:hypothetical protein
VNEPELFAQDILSAFPVFGNPVSDATVVSVDVPAEGLSRVMVRLDDADDQGAVQACDWSGAFDAAILAGQVTTGTRVKVLNGSAFILDRIIVGAKPNGQ